MENDNSIALFGTTTITITGNVTFNATGITPNFPTNTADAIFIGDGCVNTTITNNLIYTATANGIHISNSNSDITITNNCIVNNTLAGILVENSNSSITINTNNIRGNSPGLKVNLGGYTPPTTNSLVATSNYWNSPSWSKL